jgi:hypothetical protein
MEKMRPLAKLLSPAILLLLSASVHAQVPRLIQPPVYPVNGTVQYSVIAADFNGDALPDLLSAVEQYGSSADVLLNNGDGTFQTLTSFTVGKGPVRPAAGDLNDDGKLDLVVPNFGQDFSRSTVMQVLLGNGDGTFQAGVVYQVGLYPDSAAVADLNGDGNLDVVVANGDSPTLQPGKKGTSNGDAASASGTVQVLLGNGDGTLQSAIAYSTAKGPVRAAVGDLNGDGIPDIVVAADSGKAVSVLLGLGDGTFAASQDYAIGRSATDLVLTDLNQDGKTDVAVAESADVAILLNNGEGTLASPLNLPIDQPATTIDAGDLNADGNVDLVVVDGVTSIYFGNGDGTFAAPIHYLPGDQVAVIAQFDYKPGLDLVVNGTTATIPYGLALLSNQSDGTFFAPRAYPAPLAELTTVTRDLNGDGKPDLIAATGQPSFVPGTISVYLNDGRGKFPGRQDYGVGFDPVAVAIGDFDGDGKDDVAASDYLDNQLSILLGNGDGTLQAEKRYPGATTQMQGLAAGDFNGDGKDDLVSSNVSLPGKISIFLSVNGAFPTHTDLAVATAPTTVLAQDFNGDGIADIALTYTNSSQQIDSGLVSILIANGDGTFQPRVDYPLDPEFDLALLASGDVNGDGTADLVVVRSLGPTALLLGNGDGTFQSPINSPSAQIYPYAFAAGIQLADLDGDGTLDIVLVKYASICFGNGDGTFQPPQYYGTSGFYDFHSVAAADYDGDGAVDVAYGTSNISILSNTGGSRLQLLSSNNPSRVGESVTFLSRGVPTYRIGVPTGTVSFFDGSALLGTSPLAGGKARLTVSILTAGKHSIHAHYNGDGTFVPNDSKTKTQTVNP